MSMALINHLLESYGYLAVFLFVALESVAMHARSGAKFKADHKRLMLALGLSDEFWGMSSVLDRSRGPHHPPQCCAFGDWYRVRAVREQLLEATKARH